MHWDDERKLGNSLIVTLKYGLKFHEDSFSTEHVRGFDTISEAMSSVRNAIKCECNTCLERKSKLNG